MIESTLKELGNKLPISSKNIKDPHFSFKFWGLEQEKIIADIKKNMTSHGDFVNQVLVLMLDTFDGEKLDTSNKEIEGKLRLKLNQLALMDVLYMYIYLRYDQLDESIRLNVTCPSCGKLNKDFIANMEGLDVKVIEWFEKDGKDPDEEILDFPLKKPFTIDEIKVESLKIRRTPWDAMERATDDITTNSGKMMELFFDHSIMGVNDEEGQNIVDMQKLLAKLHKRDFEKLSGFITRHNAGPSLIVSDKCRYCPAEFYQQLDWSYESFFGASSLPQD